MDNRIIVIQQNVPICPNCSAMMWKRYQGNHLYFICNDCKEIFKVIENGQAEIELLATNNVNCKLEEVNE